MTAPFHLTFHRRHAADLLWLPANAVLRPNPWSDSPSRRYTDPSGAVASAIFVVTGADREQFVSELGRHFKADRWLERDTQTLNSCCGIKTSFADGWAGGHCGCIWIRDENGRPIQRPPTYRWDGEWEARSGARVGYSLTAYGDEIRGYAMAVLESGLRERQRR